MKNGNTLIKMELNFREHVELSWNKKILKS